MEDVLLDVFITDSKFFTSLWNGFAQCSIYVARGDEELWENREDVSNRK
jgi:hypothetical protein